MTGCTSSAIFKPRDLATCSGPLRIPDMRLACFVFFVACIAGCSKPKPQTPWTAEGNWKIDLPAPVSSVTQAMWENTTLRFKPDGSFVEYGGLQLAGRYEVVDGQVRLDFSKLFGTDSDFLSAKMAPLAKMGGSPLPLRMILQIAPDGSLEAKDYPPGSGQSRVLFHRSELEPLEKELRTFAKLPDNAVMTEGSRLWDDIMSRKEEALPVMASLVHDADKNVAWWAIDFLGEFKDKRAAPALIPLLNDKNRIIQRMAAKSLGEIRSPDGVEPLVKALRHGAISEYAAAGALAEIGDRRAVQPLIEALPASKKSRYIVKALGVLGDPAALPALRKLESDKSPDMIIALSTAIARLAPSDPYPKSKVPELMKLSKGADWLQQVDAMHALLAVGDPAAKGIFISLLSDRDFVIRRDAVTALGRMRAKETAPKIRQMLQDDDEQVRTAAKRALRLLEG